MVALRGIALLLVVIVISFPCSARADSLEDAARALAQGRLHVEFARGSTSMASRAIAVGTVFAWQTREYDVDDITAAIHGLFKAVPQSVESRRATQASSHQDSSSSPAQRCRFSITRASIRGTRTFRCGAGPAEAMTGTTQQC